MLCFSSWVSKTLHGKELHCSPRVSRKVRGIASDRYLYKRMNTCRKMNQQLMNAQYSYVHPCYGINGLPSILIEAHTYTSVGGGERQTEEASSSNLRTTARHSGTQTPRLQNQSNGRKAQRSLPEGSCLTLSTGLHSARMLTPARQLEDDMWCPPQDFHGT